MLKEVISSANKFIDRVKSEDPSILPRLQLYVKILEAQAIAEEKAWHTLEEFKSEINKAIDESINSGKPLLEVLGFPKLPKNIYEELFSKIVSVLKEDDVFSKDASRLEDAWKSRQLDIDELVHTGFKSGGIDFIKSMASKLGVSTELLEAITLWLIQPTLRCLARIAYSSRVVESWSRPECPVCGILARTGFLHGEGRAFYMKCSVCGMEWRMPRAICPYCGVEDVEFYTPIKTAKWLRLYVCRKCGAYWRVVDEEDEDAIKQSLLPPRELYELIVEELDKAYEELLRRRIGG